MNCWLTIGFRQEAECSMCHKKGNHREIRFNGPGYPTPCVWVHLCDACWKTEDKLETAPVVFPPAESREPAGLFYG